MDTLQNKLYIFLFYFLSIVFHPIRFKKICPWTNTPQLFLRFMAGSTQSPMVVTLTRPFHFLVHLAPNFVLAVSWFNKRDKVLFLFCTHSEAKQKPIATCLARVFSHFGAGCRLHVFASSFDWLIGFISVCCDWQYKLLCTVSQLMAKA